MTHHVTGECSKKNEVRGNNAGGRQCWMVDQFNATRQLVTRCDYLRRQCGKGPRRPVPGKKTGSDLTGRQPAHKAEHFFSKFGILR